MANLPDLNTSEVSFIGYWNAIDQGGLVEVNPSDVVSNDNIVEYTAYDNGVEGSFDVAESNINFRVKTDGWIIAWFDRQESLAIQETDKSNVYGPFDIIDGWKNNRQINGDNRDTAIQSLFGELSNSQNGNLDTSNIGYYDFANETATATSILGNDISGIDSVSHKFQYSDTTTVDDFWFVAGAEWNGGDRSLSSFQRPKCFLFQSC